jgi:glycosyltransferase involved in cell wall biosynthesis
VKDGGSYVVVTPVRDEAGNLRRLADSLRAQTVPPVRWIIVDNGSTDGTLELARTLEHEAPWVRVDVLAPDGSARRGGPVARAFNAVAQDLDDSCDVVVKVDADLSMEPDYFQRLLAEFASNPTLGMASGGCYEQDGDGVWRQRRFGARASVWGACRAYRRTCLPDVLPLVEQRGWDELDALRASLAGWQTATFVDLPFRHHRPEGHRERSRFSVWRDQGRTSYFIGYRPSYLILRALFRSLRELSELAMILGYVESAVRRAPRYENEAVRSYVRSQQRFRELPTRAREVLGKTQARLRPAGSEN